VSAFLGWPAYPRSTDLTADPARLITSAGSDFPAERCGDAVRYRIGRGAHHVCGSLYISTRHSQRAMAEEIAHREGVSPLGKQRTPKPRSSSSQTKVCRPMAGFSASTFRLVSFAISGSDQPCNHCATMLQPAYGNDRKRAARKSYGLTVGYQEMSD
jgi:hypothetical protein